MPNSHGPKSQPRLSSFYHPIDVDDAQLHGISSTIEIGSAADSLQAKRKKSKNASGSGTKKPKSHSSNPRQTGAAGGLQELEQDEGSHRIRFAYQLNGEDLWLTFRVNSYSGDQVKLVTYLHPDTESTTRLSNSVMDTTTTFDGLGFRKGSRTWIHRMGVVFEETFPGYLDRLCAEKTTRAGTHSVEAKSPKNTRNRSAEFEGDDDSVVTVCHRLTSDSRRPTRVVEYVSIQDASTISNMSRVKYNELLQGRPKNWLLHVK